MMTKPKFIFEHMDAIRDTLLPEHQELFDWLYSTSSSPILAVLILGAASAAACQNENATFWEAIAQAKKSFGDVVDKAVAATSPDKGGAEC